MTLEEKVKGHCKTPRQVHPQSSIRYREVHLHSIPEQGRLGLGIAWLRVLGMNSGVIGNPYDWYATLS